MSIYGPDETSTQPQLQREGELDLYAKKSNTLLKTGGLMHGPIDMTGHKITNVKEPIYASDVATMGFVSKWDSIVPPV